MKKEDVEAREKRLHTLLIDLSKDVQIEQESSYKRYLKRLHEIYDISDNDIYRHSYSKIFLALKDVSDSDDLSSEILIQNLQLIYYKVQQDSNENSYFRIAVYKLFDHVNLDVSRINYLKMENKDYYNKFLEGYSKLQDETEESFKEIKQSLEKTKIDTVAIIGIFTAIIIGLVSSITFSAKLLAHAHEIPPGRIMIAAATCGFVTISIFYLIYLILERLVFKSESKKIPALQHFKNYKNWSVSDSVLPLTLVVLFILFVLGSCSCMFS